MISLERLVDSSSKLGTLPAIVYRVFDAMDDPNSTATQIGRIINDDPALTARLLKLVNSPFYGFTSKVDTVYRAIALIGHRELRSVVLAASAVKVFEGIPADLVNMPAYWKRSLFTGVVARVLAAFRREKEIERYFIAGLLHDIGSLLLYLQLPEQMASVIVEQQSEDVPLGQAEKKALGYDHAQVGGALLKKWNLPPLLCQSVQYHLHPEQAPESSQEAASLLHLAWQIMNQHIDEDATEEVVNLIPEPVWEAAGLKSEILPKVLEKAAQQYLASKDVLLA